MELKLHIGTEKTGTTTFQAFLNENRDRLLNSGYLVPRSIGVGNNRALVSCAMSNSNFDDYHSANQISNLEQKKSHDKNIIELLKSEIAACSNIHTVIISSEHFHSRLVEIGEIETLYGILKDLFTSIKVYVYLRPQIEMAISLYSTVLRAGSKLKFTDFIQNNLSVDNRYYRYDILLDEWGAIFGDKNIFPKIFSRNSFLNQDLIDDFVEQLELSNIKQLKRVSNENESLNLMGQELYRASNLSQEFMTRKPYHLLEGFFTGKGAMPSKELAESLQNTFEEYNQYLFSKWFDNNESFKVDFTKYGPGNKLSSSQETLIGELFFKPNALIEEDIDYLRELAIKLEKYDINDSLKLMKIAHQYRPDGKFISKKIERYNELLK